MNKYLKEAKEISDSIISWRREIHQNPEIGDELPKTVALVKKELAAMGYTPVDMYKSGVVAVLEGEKPGKTIMLRADMDALPMTEDTDYPFASKCEYAHTCGHDMHTASLLGAAKLLMQNKKDVCGKVVFMFQPAEEILQGALGMIEAGLLDTYKPDVAFAMHTQPGSIKTGTVMFATGPLMGSSDMFKVEIEGYGSHGASPHNSIDPINIACHIHTALMNVNAREVNAQDPIILTIGALNAGNAGNIIPQTASMLGTIRTFDPKVREFIKKRVVEITSGIAAAFGGKANVVWQSGTQSLANDPALGEELAPEIVKVIGEDMLAPCPKIMGSEDFSEVCSRIPGLMVWIGTGGPEDGYAYKGHHPKVAYDEETLMIAAAVYTQVAIGYLEKNK